MNNKEQIKAEIRASEDSFKALFSKKNNNVRFANQVAG